MLESLLSSVKYNIFPNVGYKFLQEEIINVIDNF